MSKPYDLWLLYSAVYEVEVGRKYGKMGRDFADAKRWLALEPDFFERMDCVEEFQSAARNFIRNGDEFARKKKWPMWLLLTQYNEWLPAQKKKAKTVEPIDCPTCNGSMYPGEDCPHCSVKRAETL